MTNVQLLQSNVLKKVIYYKKFLKFMALCQNILRELNTVFLFFYIIV